MKFPAALALAAALCALCAAAAGESAPPPASGCGDALPCSFVCSVPPENAAAAAADAADDLDRWLDAIETCGCEPAPGPEEELEAAAPAGEGDPVAAVVDKLCANELRPWYEWSEDARRAEVTASTITLYGVTDHVHYTPVCHSMCGLSCGGVSLSHGASSSVAADVGLGNCFSEDPGLFFAKDEGILSDGGELPVNLAGFDADGADVSVAVIVSRPEWNGTSLALAYRMQDGEVEDPGRRKLLQTVASRDTLVVSRAHLTGTMDISTPSDVGVASRPGGSSTDRAENGPRGGFYGWVVAPGIFSFVHGAGLSDRFKCEHGGVGDRRSSGSPSSCYEPWIPDPSPEEKAECMWKALKMFGPKVVEARGHVKVGDWCVPRRPPLVVRAVRSGCTGLTAHSLHRRNDAGDTSLSAAASFRAAWGDRTTKETGNGSKATGRCTTTRARTMGGIRISSS